MQFEESEYAEKRHYYELLYLLQVLGIREIIKSPQVDEVYRRILAGMDCEDWDAAYVYGFTPWTPKPIEAYERLAKECRNNLRVMPSAVEAVAMLD